MHLTRQLAEQVCQVISECCDLSPDYVCAVEDLHTHAYVHIESNAHTPFVHMVVYAKQRNVFNLSVTLALGDLAKYCRHPAPMWRIDCFDNDTMRNSIATLFDTFMPRAQAYVDYLLAYKQDLLDSYKDNKHGQ